MKTAELIELLTKKTVLYDSKRDWIENFQRRQTQKNR